MQAFMQFMRLIRELIFSASHLSCRFRNKIGFLSSVSPMTFCIPSLSLQRERHRYSDLVQRLRVATFNVCVFVTHTALRENSTGRGACRAYQSALITYYAESAHATRRWAWHRPIESDERGRQDAITSCSGPLISRVSARPQCYIPTFCDWLEGNARAHSTRTLGNPSMRFCCACRLRTRVICAQARVCEAGPVCFRVLCGAHFSALSLTRRGYTSATDLQARSPQSFPVSPFWGVYSFEKRHYSMDLESDRVFVISVFRFYVPIRPPLSFLSYFGITASTSSLRQ